MKAICVVVSLALAGMVLGSVPDEAAAQDAPVAVFDYSMPDRYGLDDNGDGLIDSFVRSFSCVDKFTCVGVGPTSPLDPTPDRWTVILDACDNESTGEGHVYEWRFLDETDVEISALPSGCEFEADVPAEGSYRVELSVSSSEGDSTVVQEVVVQDWLIISMGDSYGSGEGNPEVEQRFSTDDGGLIAGAKWSDRRCHRSQFAGSARAALALESLDPRTSVTFVHVACSGATIAQIDPTLVGGEENDEPIGGGLTEPYHGADSPEKEASEEGTIDPLPPQIEQVAALIGDREVDVAYLSIGGNDALFAPVVASCLALDPCNPVAQGLDDGLYPDLGLVFGVCAAASVITTAVVGALLAPVLTPIVTIVCPMLIAAFIGDFANGTAEEWFRNGIVGDGDLADPPSLRLSQLYDRLNEAMFTDSAGPQLPAGHADRLFISEYVDATRDEDGYCPANEILDPARDLALPGGTTQEATWIDQVFETTLNEMVAFNADRFGWTLVDGIYDAFRGHGMCASDTWMRGLFESFLVQGDKSGVVHPNRTGHLVFRNRILERWLPALYPDTDPDASPGFPNDNIQPAEAILLVTDWISDHDPRRPDQPPVADAGGPYRLDEGSSLAADNGSYDPDGDPITHSWVSADPSTATVAPSDGDRPTITAIDDGLTALELTVTDEDGTDIDHAAVEVTNVAPSLTAPTTYSGEEGPVELALDIADPGTADTHTLTADWGDGTVAGPDAAVTGPVTIDHEYRDDGNFTVDVEAADDDGGAATATIAVELENVAPTVTIATPSGAPAEGATFAISAAYTDPGAADTHRATVSWGDGTGENLDPTPGAPMSGSAGVVAASHVYADDGNRVVEICVVDDDGGRGCDATTLTVANAAPTASLVADVGTEAVLPGLPVPVEGSFVDPGTLDTHTAVIDWGDATDPESLIVNESPFGPPGSTAGASGSTDPAAHVYASAGDYTAALTVTDDDGGVGVATTAISVVTPAAALGDTVSDLLVRTDDTALDPRAVRWIERAVKLLAGNRSGAIVLLEEGDVVGAAAEIHAAHGALAKAESFDSTLDLGEERAALVRVLASLASTTVLDTATVADPETQEFLEALLAYGRSLEADGDLDAAALTFVVVIALGQAVLG